MFLGPQGFDGPDEKEWCPRYWRIWAISACMASRWVFIKAMECSRALNLASIPILISSIWCWRDPIAMLSIGGSSSSSLWLTNPIAWVEAWLVIAFRTHMPSFVLVYPIHLRKVKLKISRLGISTNSLPISGTLECSKIKLRNYP